MPRRRTAKIKYQVKMTRRISLQRRPMPVEYSYLATDQLDTIRCASCGATLQRWRGERSERQTCPICGQEIDPVE